MGIKTAATEHNDRMDGAFEPRLEDYRLLTGAGNFQDDEATAGTAWGVFVRSPHAFADIRGIDTASAQAAPGVLAVLTAAALDAPQIWPEAPGSIAVCWLPSGAKSEDPAELDRIFAGAVHIASVRLVK